MPSVCSDVHVVEHEGDVGPLLAGSHGLLFRYIICAPKAFVLSLHLHSSSEVLMASTHLLLVDNATHQVIAQHLPLALPAQHNYLKENRSYTVLAYSEPLQDIPLGSYSLSWYCNLPFGQTSPSLTISEIPVSRTVKLEGGTAYGYPKNLLCSYVITTLQQCQLAAWASLSGNAGKDELEKQTTVELSVLDLQQSKEALWGGQYTQLYQRRSVNGGLFIPALTLTAGKYLLRLHTVRVNEDVSKTETVCRWKTEHWQKFFGLALDIHAQR